FMHSSRHELMAVFRRGSVEPFDNLELPEGESLTHADPYNSEVVETENSLALDRAIDAESLGITQEEHVILTKQGFWSQVYFEKKYNRTLLPNEYQDMIGLKEVWKYYGYTSEVEMKVG